MRYTVAILFQLYLYIYNIYIMIFVCNDIFTILSSLVRVLFSSNAAWGNSKRFHFLQLSRMKMLLLIGLKYPPTIVLFPNDRMVSMNRLDCSLHKIFWMPCLEENNWSFLFCFLGCWRHIDSVETGRQSSMQKYITLWCINFLMLSTYGNIFVTFLLTG